MAVVNTPVTIPAGVTSTGDVVVSGGSLIVSAGGAIVGTVVADGGFTTVLPGATATGTMVADEHGLFDGRVLWEVLRSPPWLARGAWRWWLRPA